MIDAASRFLIQQITKGQLNTKNSILLDVGAYHGDFTKELLPHINKAILFEANKNNFEKLKIDFAEKPVTLFNLAISDRTGSIPFFCSDDEATGSLLPYLYTSSPTKQSEVTLTTLDYSLSEINEPISIIKIDTQGNDLKVLQGAQETIKKHQPWIVVELIYLPLYEAQAHPQDIAAWLAEKEYVHAGLFNIHYSSDGWLAFADGVFVPKNTIKTVREPFYLDSKAEVEEENKLLKTVCEERLALINRLDADLKQAALALQQNKSSLIAKFFRIATKTQ